VVFTRALSLSLCVRILEYSVCQQNWRLRPAPITSALAWKEVKVGGRWGNKARKHVTCSGAKRIIVGRWFPVNANCFVTCIFMQRIKYSCCCTLIRELSNTNPRLQQRRLQHYTRNRCELAATQFGC
jgi:hypothetical protein